MKNDTSLYNLDEMLAPKKQEVIEPQQVVEPIKVNWDKILQEVSYKLPKGYPTIVGGKFVDREEVVVINEHLLEYGLQLPVPPTNEISQAAVSSNKTDVKEALVIAFFDCLRVDTDFTQLYESLLLAPDPQIISELKNTLEKSKSLNSDYGVNVSNLHKYIVDVLSSEDRSSSNTDLRVINNGFSAANTIITNPKVTGYIGSKKYATRGDIFNQIRKDAVTVYLPKVGVTGLAPDNWCPGDFYLMNKPAVPKEDNLIEFNSHFTGPGYPDGDILAISLKMEEAQAGKGTTFISSVLKPKEISVSKAHATNTDSKLGKQYLEAKRRYEKNESYKDSNTLYAKLSGYAKLIHNLAKSKGYNKMPTLDKFQAVSKKNERVAFFAKNRKGVLQDMAGAFAFLDPSILGSKQTAAYKQGFVEAYTDFVKYLNKIKIKTSTPTADKFIKDIESSKGAKLEGGLTKLLIKKADTYSLAIKLIQSWSDENKAIMEPFKRLGVIENPLLAITMFAIAQHGANPNFIKVHGSNTALLGTAEIFPAKSKVDEKMMVQSARIEDSPGAAGFDVVYNMKLNGVTYSTRLTFRFSTTQIRVEVQELEVQK